MAADAVSAFDIKDKLMVKLCVDAGHGMSNSRAGIFDPGAEAGGVSEAEVVLAFALGIQFVFQGKILGTGKSLEDRLFLTRASSQQPAPLRGRVRRAELAGCTHFLALHLNDGGGQGTEAFYRDSADKEFAEKVLQIGLSTLHFTDRGVKAEGESQHSRLAIFDFDGPTTLIELGFVDNSTERGKLLTHEARLAFAEGIWSLFSHL